MNELRELNRQLESLLADPHPGLASWCAALSGTLLGMALFSGVDAVVLAAQVALDKTRNAERKANS